MVRVWTRIIVFPWGWITRITRHSLTTTFAIHSNTNVCLVLGLALDRLKGWRGGGQEVGRTLAASPRRGHIVTFGFRYPKISATSLITNAVALQKYWGQDRFAKAQFEWNLNRRRSQQQRHLTRPITRLRYTMFPSEASCSGRLTIWLTWAQA